MKRYALAFTAALLLFAAAGCSPSAQRSIYERLVSMDRAASHLTPRAVDVGNLTMTYLERPGSGDTLVLVHGFSGEKDNWTRFVRYLPKEYRVIAIDMPGHGDSDKPANATYTAEFFTEYLSRAVDALKLGKFHLAGNSMGGYISILYASRNPGRVIDLCLIDNAGIFKEAPKQSDLMIAMAHGKSPLTPTTEADFDVLLDYAFYKKPFMPWPVKNVLRRKALESGPFVKKMFKDFNSDLVDPVPLLPGLRMPVLVIWGDHDRILHVSTTEVLDKGLPDKEIVIMKNCGHVPMLERPKETAGYYASFLGRHKGKG
jgi:abhydrolase domain-containing protein 6